MLKLSPLFFGFVSLTGTSHGQTVNWKGVGMLAGRNTALATHLGFLESGQVECVRLTSLKMLSVLLRYTSDELRPENR